MSFVTAIPMAIKVAGMLGDGIKFVADHPEEVKMAIDEASKAVESAKRFAGKTKEVVAASETVAKAKKTATDAGAAIKASNKASGDAISNLAQKAKLAASRVGTRKDETPEEAAARKAEAEAAKAIEQARQAVLTTADLRTSLDKLVNRLDSSDDEVVAKTLQLLDGPGILVIATYSRLDLDRDLTDYRGVYVGAGSCVGDCLAHTISRGGNPDVYADIKYGKNVLLYVFACAEDELEDRRQALIEVLGAANSYNMPIREA